jgi:hypothetical protein
MNDTAALQYVKQLFADHWPAASYPILFSNPPDGQFPVQPIGARELPGFPATFLAVVDEVTSTELVTSTTTEIRGAIVVRCWCEVGADEDSIVARHTELRAMFKEHGDTPGMQFFPGQKGDVEFPEDDSPWFGRPINFPYVRYDEEAP